MNDKRYEYIKKEINDMIRWRRTVIILYGVILLLVVLGPGCMYGHWAIGETYAKATGLNHGRMSFEAYESEIMAQFYTFEGYGNISGNWFYLVTDPSTFDYSTLNFNAISNSKGSVVYNQNGDGLSLSMPFTKDEAQAYDEAREYVKAGFEAEMKRLDKIGMKAVLSEWGWIVFIFLVVCFGAVGVLLFWCFKLRYKNVIKDLEEKEIEVYPIKIEGMTYISNRRRNVRYVQFHFENELRNIRVSVDTYLHLEDNKNALLIKYKNADKGVYDVYDVLPNLA